MGLNCPYLVGRLLDTFLREDLFAMLSQGTVQSAPAEFPRLSDQWLRYRWDDQHIWWIPVRQDAPWHKWRSAAPLVVEEGSGRSLTSLDEVLAPALERVDEREALLQEVECALDHRHRTEAVRQQWFATRPTRHFQHWWESLAFYERLASFHDHPYYPTARAKVGLDGQALRLYAPEFAPTFRLRWLAVPDQEVQGQLPPGWPRDKQFLGLPVHPHTAPQLTLPDGAYWLATDDWLVQPTLSVRTVSLLAQPALHLKLPLLMRSLSYKNLRKIRPDTIADGHTVQQILARRVPADCLLSDESTGFSVDGRSELGVIVRRYPDLQDATVLPVAALLAADPEGGTVLQQLIRSHFRNSEQAFFESYLELTLRIHVDLWVSHGIALESNQQNTLLVLHHGKLQLLLKDNDAARIYEEVAQTGATFVDPCLPVHDWLPIAQMFITITLQLNIMPLIESSSRPAHFYQLARHLLERQLAVYPAERVEACGIRRHLLESPLHPVKYLFSAGTLFSKQRTGAADINKHYGLTGANPLYHA
ncbi:MAG: siderophore biosynthesis protein [Candidatus Eremiobacteraeota bacterium]|nr:siderophore biosynthesis protein [Candidatus Eremiobacteraeota bacterium]MCW5871959.1 siderophore biosynthesis protein [Candidatus Eremiobacteraeota bacterium]